MENLWHTLKQRVYSHNPNNIEDLRMNIEEEIANMTPKECKNLVSSMKNRVRMIIEKEGDVIPY